MLYKVIYIPGSLELYRDTMVAYHLCCITDLSLSGLAALFLLPHFVPRLWSSCLALLLVQPVNSNTMDFTFVKLKHYFIFKMSLLAWFKHILFIEEKKIWARLEMRQEPSSCLVHLVEHKFVGLVAKGCICIL